MTIRLQIAGCVILGLVSAAPAQPPQGASQDSHGGQGFFSGNSSREMRTMRGPSPSGYQNSGVQVQGTPFSNQMRRVIQTPPGTMDPSSPVPSGRSKSLQQNSPADDNSGSQSRNNNLKSGDSVSNSAPQRSTRIKSVDQPNQGNSTRNPVKSMFNKLNGNKTANSKVTSGKPSQDSLSANEKQDAHEPQDNGNAEGNEPGSKLMNSRGSTGNVHNTELNPAMERMKDQIPGVHPDYAPSTPHSQRAAFDSSLQNLRSAYKAGNDEAIDSEIRQLNQRSAQLKGSLPTLKAGQQLSVSSIQTMYNEGIKMVQEGRENQESCKVKMGFERIDEANRQLGELQEKPK